MTLFSLTPDFTLCYTSVHAKQKGVVTPVEWTTSLTGCRVPFLRDKRSILQRKCTTYMMDSDKQMFDVDVDCAECGNHISQLPFQPSGDKPIYCKDCLRAKRQSARPPRQMYDVDLSCAECGTHISQLPFQPSGDRPVYCADCNRARRGA